VIVIHKKFRLNQFFFCDWYSGTINEEPDTIFSTLMEDLEGVRVARCGGPGQYEQTVGIFQEDDPDPIMSLSFGGNQGNDPYFRARGQYAETVCPAIRKHFPVHKVSRLDVAIDFLEVGMYDRISAFMMSIHKQRGVRAKTINHDVPEMGRTHYLGAGTSRVMTRLYEKDKQLEQQMKTFVIGHVRLEVEIKPKKPAEKLHWASVSMADAWGASPTTAQLINDVLSLNPEPIRREKQIMRTDEDKLIALYLQYTKLFCNVGKDRSLQLLEDMFKDGIKPLKIGTHALPRVVQ
jgi:hypothetical protein